MRFGRRLRQLLWERAIGPAEFARAIGVTPGYISRMLMHPEVNPSSAVFCKILFGFSRFGEAKRLSVVEISELAAARYSDSVGVDGAPRAKVGDIAGRAGDP